MTNFTNASANIDEFSAVMFVNRTISDLGYARKVQNLLDEIDRTFQLSLFYGYPTETKLVGYKEAITYDGRVLIGYHSKLKTQGVYVRFTSTGLDEICDRLTLTTLQVYQLLCKLVDSNKDFEIIRMSRCDLCIDFVDFSIDGQTYITVDDICKKYSSSENEVMLCSHGEKANGDIRYRIYNKKVTLHGGLDEVTQTQRIDTMEFGSRSALTLLRIYNKKAEQIAKGKDARYLGTAANCQAWTRFELQCNGKFAWSVGDRLKQLENADFMDFVASTIYHKYHFATYHGINTHTKEPDYVDWDISDYIITKLCKSIYAPVRSAITLPKDFSDKFDYYFGNNAKSGVIGFLWVCNELYGKNFVDSLFDKIKADISVYHADDKQKQLVAKTRLNKPDTSYLIGNYAVRANLRDKADNYISDADLQKLTNNILTTQANNPYFKTFSDDNCDNKIDND